MVFERKRKYPKKETPFLKAFMKEFDKQCYGKYGVWWVKIHGL